MLSWAASAAAYCRKIDKPVIDEEVRVDAKRERRDACSPVCSDVHNNGIAPFRRCRILQPRLPDREHQLRSEPVHTRDTRRRHERRAIDRVRFHRGRRRSHGDAGEASPISQCRLSHGGRGHESQILLVLLDLQLGMIGTISSQRDKAILRPLGTQRRRSRGYPGTTRLQ